MQLYYVICDSELKPNDFIFGPFSYDEALECLHQCQETETFPRITHSYIAEAAI